MKTSHVPYMKSILSSSTCVYCWFSDSIGVGVILNVFNFPWWDMREWEQIQRANKGHEIYFLAWSITLFWPIPWTRTRTVQVISWSLQDFRKARKLIFRKKKGMIIFQDADHCSIMQQHCFQSYHLYKREWRAEKKPVMVLSLRDKQRNESCLEWSNNLFTL